MEIDLEKVKSVLLDRTSSVIVDYEEKNCELGGRFNLFSILNIERKEVSTHSAFIFELINPAGSHCQKFLYLKLFCEKVLKIYDFDYLTASVDREKFAGEFGRIDILISSSNYRIVIEVKVDAGDQHCQLQRYSDYLKKSKTEIQSSRIYYLTLDGTKPSDDSYGELDESAKNEICLISFKKDIHDWLIHCIQVKKIDKVKEAVSQYLDLIKKITNNSDQEMDDKVKDIILENIANYKAALCISNTMSAARQEILNKFIFEIKGKLSQSDYIQELLDDINFDKYYTLPKNRSAYLAYLLKKTDCENINIYLCVELKWKLYYSIWVAKAGDDGNIDWETQLAANEIDDIKTACLNNLEGNMVESKKNNCLGWNFIGNTEHNVFNFYEAESEYNVEYLVDEERFKLEVDNIYEKLQEVIQTFIL